MIKFVDIETGNIFDGSQPYTFWFDKEQSVSLNYVKTICFISDAPSVTVKLDSEVFSLIDVTRLTDPTIINYKNFYDLHKLTHADDTKITELELTGIPYNDVYIYSLYILGQGKYVGTITDSFCIDTESFNIGADFYDENETLGINLSNMGFDSIQDIQRAIYENNINEQKPDYILLNRKYKELLNEYINVVANKGSYKSLLNSVNWFEYGDLVKIMEYWRYNEIDRTMLSKKDIEQVVTPKVNKMLSDFQKTTYIGLYCALKNYYKENDKIKYIPYTYSVGNKLLPEINPEIKNVSTLWTREEMSIKMVLLGNFFSTYFMPIHIDLIHSTIEDVVFTNNIKMHTGGIIERYDTINEIDTIKCTLDKAYHLKNVNCFVNLDTVMGLYDEPQYYINYYKENSGALPYSVLPYAGEEQMVCVDPEQHNSGNTEDSDVIDINSRIHFLYRYNGIGALIPFNCILENVYDDKTIKSGKIIITYKNANHPQIIKESTNVKHTPDEGKTFVEEKFNVLLKDVDDYHIQLEFTRSDGYKYIKCFDITVDSDTYETLSLYKLVKRYSSQAYISEKVWDWQGDTPLAIDNFPDYMMNPIGDYSTNIYRQFFSNSPNKNIGIASNQIIVLKRNPNTSNVITVKLKNSNDLKIYTNQARIEGKTTTPFICLFFNKNGEIDLTGGYNYNWVVIINKFFTNDTENFKRIELSPENNISTSDGAPFSELYTFDGFVPYFWKLEKVWKEESTDGIYAAPADIKDTYTVHKNDTVCFLPDNCVFNKPTDFMWRFTNQSTGEIITPITWRNGEEEDGLDATRDRSGYSYPTMLQPLLGRYDFATGIKPGYYDVEFQYSFGADNNKKTKSVKSYFLIEK